MAGSRSAGSTSGLRRSAASPWPPHGLPLAASPWRRSRGAPTTAILTCPIGNFTCALTPPRSPRPPQPERSRRTRSSEDLGYYCVPGSPSDPACHSGDTPIQLNDLVQGPAAQHDARGSARHDPPPTAYDWEALPLPRFPLQDFSNDGGVVGYKADFVYGRRVRAPTPPRRSSSTFRQGGRYVPGSTDVESFFDGSTAIGTAEPTLNAAGDRADVDCARHPAERRNRADFRRQAGARASVTASATARIQPAGSPSPSPAPTPASTGITADLPGQRQPGRPGDIEGPPPPPLVAPDTLYMGYTPNGGRHSLLPAARCPPQGTQVTVHLSHLHVDDDLVVFGTPPRPRCATPEPGAESPWGARSRLTSRQCWARTRSRSPLRCRRTCPRTIG